MKPSEAYRVLCLEHRKDPKPMELDHEILPRVLSIAQPFPPALPFAFVFSPDLFWLKVKLEPTNYNNTQSLVLSG